MAKNIKKTLIEIFTKEQVIVHLSSMQQRCFFSGRTKLCFFWNYYL